MDYPNLTTIRANTLDELDIKFIRIEDLYENHSTAELQALRSVTDSLGIQWMDMVWSAPTAYTGSGNKLNDVTGFANWWADHVDL